MKGTERNALCPECGKKKKRCSCTSLWRTNAKLAAIILSVFTLGIAAAFLTKSTSSSQSSDRRSVTHNPAAEEAFLELVRTNPSPAVRKIERMLQRGEVRFATTYRHPGLYGPQVPQTILYVPRERLFAANPAFLLGAHIPECVRVIALRHEAKHLDDDLAGMDIPWEFSVRTPEEWLPRIRKVLHSEWRAALAERELLGIVECPQYNQLYLDEKGLCAVFKRELFTNNFHIPREFFRVFPEIRQWIESLDCVDLAGPF